MNDDQIIMPDTGPSRADALRNRALLLQTALRLFSENGVDNVTMTELARVAGVGKGTLYRHFNNKTEVCYALLDQQQRELQDRTLERLNNQVSPLETLRWFLAQVARFVIRNDEMLFAAVDAQHGSSLTMEAHIWWRQTIRGLLASLDTPGDVDYLSDILYVMLDIDTIHFQHRHLEYSEERIIDGLLTTLDRILD